ncbi:hypothetical protein NFI96_029586 [Prochilodus magdalenae]|nr:hypothetical protein NFI96_029586 [Prochilodus magdalenae]
MNDTLTNSTDYSTGWHFSVSPFFTISIRGVWGLMRALTVFNSLEPRAVVEMLFVLLGPFQALCSLNLCLMEPLGFLLGTFFSSRCVFPCCVCLERYLAVVHPVTFLRYKPLRYRVACSVMAWMCSLANGAACSYTPFPLPALPGLSQPCTGPHFDCGRLLLCVDPEAWLKDPGPRGREGEEVEISTDQKESVSCRVRQPAAALVQTIPRPLFAFGIHNMLPMD